jgi:SAM-dependent methyltransferase
MEGFQFQFDDAGSEAAQESTSTNIGGGGLTPAWWESVFAEAHRQLSLGDEIHERTVGWFKVSAGTHQATQVGKSTQSWIGDGVVVLMSGNIRVPKLELAHQQTAPSSSGGTATTASVGDDTVAAPESNRFQGQDIVPGVYLGGLKMWSCAPTLAQYLAREVSTLTWTTAELGPCSVATRALGRLMRAGGSVLELGCGHAVPSLALFKALLKARGSPVNAPIDATVLDFNEEVIDVVTLPNFRLNFAEGVAENVEGAPADAKAGFQLSVASGDWSKFVPSPSSKKYDVILGSDVTYDDAVTASVLCCIGRLLKPEEGVALIGTKPFYFGTGGGFRAMEEIARGLLQRAAAGGGEDADVFARYRLELQVVLSQRDGDSMDRLLVAVRLVPK